MLPFGGPSNCRKESSACACRTARNISTLQPSLWERRSIPNMVPRVKLCCMLRTKPCTEPKPRAAIKSPSDNPMRSTEDVREALEHSIPILIPSFLRLRSLVPFVGGNELRIALADEVFIEASASHHVVVGKCDWGEPHLPAELLVPKNTPVGHAQELLGCRALRALEFRKRRFHVPMGMASVAQPNRVLKCRARPGAD